MSGGNLSQLSLAFMYTPHFLIVLPFTTPQVFKVAGGGWEGGGAHDPSIAFYLPTGML